MFFSNCLHQRMQSYIGCICLSFLHCVFPNLSSVHLQKRMHSHIGCICLTSLHCEFSNVLSNYMLVRMHSHIGCICLIFLRRVFSNVSSNGLPERMHNHTGCICLTFHRYEISNVSSNGLLERMQNRTGCICLTFLCHLSLSLVRISLAVFLPKSRCSRFRSISRSVLALAIFVSNWYVKRLHLIWIGRIETESEFHQYFLNISKDPYQKIPIPEPNPLQSWKTLPAGPCRQGGLAHFHTWTVKFEIWFHLLFQKIKWVWFILQHICRCR